MQTKKLNVVHIIDRLNAGGAERIAITLCNLFQSKDHKVKMLTTVSEGPLMAQLNKGIEIKNLRRKWKWNPFTMYNLVKEVKKFDVIHVHSSHNLRYVFLAAKLFLLKKKIFFHEHFGNRANEEPSLLQKVIFPKTIFIAASVNIKNWALEKLKLKRSQVFVLPNIVIKEHTNMAKRENYITKKLVIVSNFLPVKNLEFAMDVFEQLVIAEKTNFRFTIIGNVADETYFNKIKNLAVEKKIQDKISFIHNCISVQTILPEYDLGLHTSTSESGPLVLIEYLAQGLPFITYETGEVAAQIKNDLPECIMHSFNKEEWVEAIYNLLNADKDALQKRMNTAFEKYFSAENYYQQCIAIYEAGLNLK